MAVSEAKRRRRPAMLARMSQALTPSVLFLRNFVRSPAMIGSVIPSSQSLIDRMLDRVDWSEVKLFVEYGPGVGTFTRPILTRLRPDATLIAIDTNQDFARYISRTISDSRLLAVQGSAADVVSIIRDQGHERADHILSGIPFSTLPAGIGDTIMDETLSALKPGGSFLVYQYSAFTLPMLKARFDRVWQGREFMNFPPCRIFEAWKTKDNDRP